MFVWTVRFEKHCVLFNIGALYRHVRAGTCHQVECLALYFMRVFAFHSLQAVKEDRTSAEGLKRANKLFMSAAGIFRYLSDNHGNVVVEP